MFIVRQLWRRLTSMRTAIVLLFLLALAAVPGSLLPQRSLNPTKVDAYIASHGAWGRFLDKIGGFEVFGSFWFSAIYLLLFASLIGCLIPRISVYARALRKKPIKAPKHLGRLAENTSFSTTLSADEVARRATKELRPRWRTVTRDEGGSITVSAEKGYSREAGNLVFHICLLAALILVAVGKLYSYQGSIVSVEGTGFCNRPINYDTFHAGRQVNTGQLSDLCLEDLNSFTATYRSDGTPSQFKADVTYSTALNGPTKHDVITVNHPLRADGDRVYLINHGFAPTVTVTRPGKQPTEDNEAFLPEDQNYTSEGAFSFASPDSQPGDDIGLSGVFAPDPSITNKVVTSLSPQPKQPVLALLAYKGTLNPNGQPQSVYSLNTDAIASGKLKQVAAKNLTVGESMTLPDGTTVRFDGYKQWATLQVSHDPTQLYLLIAAVLMVVGLLGSIAIRRRRLWLRITPANSADPSAELSSRRPNGGSPSDDSSTSAGRTLVAVGGLARSDSGNFSAEFVAVVERLTAALGRASAPLPERVPAGKD